MWWWDPSTQTIVLIQTSTSEDTKCVHFDVVVNPVLADIDRNIPQR
jgi:hypothetical protein